MQNDLLTNGRDYTSYGLSRPGILGSRIEVSHRSGSWNSCSYAVQLLDETSMTATQEGDEETYLLA